MNTFNGKAIRIRKGRVRKERVKSNGYYAVFAPNHPKSIYESKGRVAEYSKYAVSFFNGCSCNCSYCFNKKGRFAKVLGGDTPTLKKCFKSEEHALEVFEKELKANLPELQKHGLFLSFTTDPMLLPIINITTDAIMTCLKNNVPVKILTKRAEWIERHGTWSGIINKNYNYWYRDISADKVKRLVAFGFTLTGHDDLEPNASTNAERIEAMRKLNDEGFKTWASIEPVIDFENSLRMINETRNFCYLYKIGLESGKKYDQPMLQWFIQQVIMQAKKSKIYFKDGLLKQAGISRENLPENCIGRDYNMFSD